MFQVGVGWLGVLPADWAGQQLLAAPVLLRPRQQRLHLHSQLGEALSQELETVFSSCQDLGHWWCTAVAQITNLQNWESDISQRRCQYWVHRPSEINTLQSMFYGVCVNGFRKEIYNFIVLHCVVSCNSISRWEVGACDILMLIFLRPSPNRPTD